MELARLELLASIAKMYFEEGMTQDQIAARCGYSRSMVSRFLIDARENKIVEIKINYPLERNQTLESKLIEYYDLKVAWVLTRRSLSYDQMVRRLGILGARLLDELVGPGMTIGISWGAALSETINSVASKPFLDIYVVQLIGAPGTSADTDAHGMVQRLARDYGGSYGTLSAPLFVDSESVRDSLLKDRRIKAILLNAEDMDLALVGIGDLTPENSGLIRSGYLNLKEAQELEDAGAVGEVCGIFYDLFGDLVDHPLARRVVGVNAEALRSAPIRLGVAGGHPKIMPVLGAIRAGFVNTLVTDDVVANSLIQIIEGINQEES